MEDENTTIIQISLNMSQTVTEPLAKAQRPEKPKKKVRKGDTLWSMLPSRHKDVLSMLRGDNLKFKSHNNDDSASCIED